MDSFRDIIELWPSREALAADLELDSRTVSKWWQRNSIPATRWTAILSTARAQEAGLSPDLLTFLAGREAFEARAC